VSPDREAPAGGAGAAPSGDLALALGGGGARAAYQVGVLRALARRRPDLRVPLLTGVSAGAINAVGLAHHPGGFAEAVERLRSLWLALDTERVFRTDLASLAWIALRWLTSLATGRSRLAPPPQGLVDTSPLRRFLEEALDCRDGRLGGVEENLRSGRLRALAITTTHYGTGRSITWVRGAGIEPWRRPHREAVHGPIGLEHVLASAAIPVVFPAVRLGREWHGDGGIRQIAPLSPALHLGAARILTVSTRAAFPAANPDAREAEAYPAPAQIAGVLLNAVFLDMLDFDVMNLNRISALVSAGPGHEGLRPVRALVLRPSRDLAAVAAEHAWRLPRALRFLLHGLGTDERRSADLLSMILFEPPFIRRLIELGESDTEEKAGDYDAFLDA